MVSGAFRGSAVIEIQGRRSRPSQLIPSVRRLVAGRAGPQADRMAESQSRLTRSSILFWTGVLCAVANGFILQELVRFVDSVMESVSVGQPMRGGWLTMSRAAVPASWVYWASHAWLIVAALHLHQRPSAPSSAAAQPGLWRLLLIVALEVAAIHGIVWMVLPYWRLTPSLW